MARSNSGAVEFSGGRVEGHANERRVLPAWYDASVNAPRVERSRGLGADAARRLAKDRVFLAAAATLVALVAASVLAPWLSAHRYDHADLALGATPPSWSHWFGTDGHGRDLLARVFFGGRVSLAVGVIATLMSFGIGVGWGGVAGSLGGRADALMMRVVDALYTLPLLPLVILVLVFFGDDRTFAFRAFRAGLGLVAAHPEDPSYRPLFQIVLVFASLGAVSWLTTARITRGQVLSLREQPFVEAARSLGAGQARILFRHLLPNALGPVLVYAALTVPEVMMTEAFLSFLGLGTQEPLSSWGQLAAMGAESMDLHPWLLAFPAFFLAITLFCFNLLGEGLREALDPRGAPGAG
jgi:oligopeptide transport system permease protein